MNITIKIFLTLIFILFSFESHANRYWVAKDNGNTHYWDDRANWSDRSGGKGGKTIPNNKTKVYFDNKGKGDVTFRSKGQSRRVTISGNYNGTINLNGKDLSVHQYILVGAGTTIEVPSGSKITTTQHNSTIRGTVNAENGSLVFGKGLTITSTGTLNAPSGAMQIRGNFNNSGTFNHNNGTVYLNTKQNINLNMGGTGSGKDLYNLTKSGKHRVTLKSNISVNNFTMNKNGGIWRANGKTMYVSKNWTIYANNYSGFVHQNGTVVFNGTSAQYINAVNGESDFYNVTISNTSSSAVSLSKQIDVKNTLTIDSNAKLDINGHNIEINTLVNNGNFQLQGGETLSIDAMDTDSGTVTYDGTGNNTELAAGYSYYNLTLDKSAGSIRLGDNLDVNGNLTITDGTLYAASSGGTNYNINVAGNWTNNDTFVSGSGTVTFDGTSTITSGGISDDTQDFHNVILSGSSATQNTNAVEVDGDFTISSSGTWDTNGLCIYIEGNTSTGSGTLTNTTLPSLTFSPANSADDVAITSNITITSNVALRKLDNTELTNTNIDALITLKENNASGSNINFDATIDSDKKIITINPDSNFSSEQTIYVAIGATVENSCDNAVTASSATFTSVDANIPTLVSSSPSDDGTGVGINDNIVLTFSEAVDAESGNIIIKKSSDNSTIETIGVTDAKISGSGSTEITINPATTLDSSTGYYLTIAATAFDDSSSNSYAGINDATTLNFTTEDAANPTLSSSSPSDGSTNVGRNANIVLTFNEAVDAESGNIIIKKSSDDSEIETIAVTDAKISGSGSTEITINPATTLDSSTSYYLTIAATAFDDSSGNSYAGINDATTLNFTTEDAANPTLSSSNPSDGATTVGINDNIVLTFNEAVDAESGNIIIKKSSDDSSIETIAVTDAKISGSGSTEITINPATTLDCSTGYYLTIAATAFDDSSSNSYAGINDATTLNFTTSDSCAPTVIFSPTDSSTGVSSGTNITLTFNEAIRNTDDTAVTDSNVDSLITLKDTNASGADIAFDATIDSDKKIITINPDNDFSSNQTVYVAIGDTVEDTSDNAISASSITFTSTTSESAPTLTFNPSNNSSSISVDSNITITFSKAIRHLNNSILTNDNIDSLITLRDTDANGTRILFNATIDSVKKVITINPTNDFDSEQTIYVAIGESVEDSFDNAITASSITFTSADTASPTFVFNPDDLSTEIAVSANITITFNEAIRNTDDSALTNSNVDSLITLKDSDSSGDDISFDATIDSDKEIITINPDSNFSSEQTVYVAISDGIEDSSDNAITAASISFIVADSNPPDLTFTPLNSATGIAINSDINISFSEAIRNTDDTAVTDSNVDSLITLKDTNSSGANIAFEAIIDDKKQLITIIPNSSFTSEQTIYVAIGATVEDAANNAITASSITFTTADSTAPSVNFVPPDTSTGIPITSDVTLTFNEAVRNLDDSAITNSNAADLITLEYVSDNSPIAFSATIDSDKKVITISPDNDFISGEVVFVSISSVEDSSDNAMGATSGSFSVTDSTAPVVTISPADQSTSVEVDTDITISFDEEVRLINNSAITNSNVDSLITVKNTNSTGSDIAFDAVIDSDNKVITIDLDNDLTSEQIVYVSIGATVEDSYDNAISATSATFTVADNLPPTVAIEAVITRSIAIDSDITFTFTEAVRNLDDSELTNSNVASLITLKDTDQNGIDLTFSATINNAKTIITIDPTNNFTSGQKIYAAIGASVEDYSDNLVPASSKTFIAEYLAADLDEPFVEKDLVSLVEAQSEISELFIKESINPVLDRLEWIRRNNNSKNLSLQGIDFNFENDKLNELSSIISIPLAAKESINFLPEDMGIWTEGSITLGEINATNISSLKEIRTNGVTIGIDRILNNELIIGGAIRFGKDHVDIESSRNFINSHNKSITFYGSKKIKNNTFIDFVMGLSSLKIKQERIHISGSYSGKRYANQYYSSLVYSGKIKKNKLTLSPYGRIDRGYTSLSSYEEKGKTAALRYNKQNVVTNTTSVGLLTNYKKNFKYVRLNTVARLEYGKEFNKTDDIQASYLVKNQDHIIKINDQEKNHRKYGISTDINILRKFNVNINYENENIQNYGKINIYKINSSYSPSLKYQYNLKLIQNDKDLSSIKLNFSYKITNNWNLNIDNTVMKNDNKYLNNSINFNTKINF